MGVVISLCNLARVGKKIGELLMFICGKYLADNFLFKD